MEPKERSGSGIYFFLRLGERLLEKHPGSVYQMGPIGAKRWSWWILVGQDSELAS
jgi:hypothetical protein